MRTPNTKRKFGESNAYIHAKINGRDALLTPDAARVAVERAERQPEDLPSLPQRLKNWFFSL